MAFELVAIMRSSDIQNLWEFNFSTKKIWNNKKHTQSVVHLLDVIEKELSFIDCTGPFQCNNPTQSDPIQFNSNHFPFIAFNNNNSTTRTRSVYSVFFAFFNFKILLLFYSLCITIFLNFSPTSGSNCLVANDKYHMILVQSCMSLSRWSLVENHFVRMHDLLLVSFNWQIRCDCDGSNCTASLSWRPNIESVCVCSVFVSSLLSLSLSVQVLCHLPYIHLNLVTYLNYAWLWRKFSIFHQPFLWNLQKLCVKNITRWT